MNYKYYFCSDKGKVRSKNEDRIFANDKTHFFSVIDGMGGLPCGEQTSQYAVDHFQDYLKSIPKTQEDLENIVKSICGDIYELANKDCGYPIYGATIVSALVNDDTVSVVSLGDCRCYHISGDTTEVITEDHSIVGYLVKMGEITEEEALKHPSRSKVTQYLGMNPQNAHPCVVSTKVKSGDYIVLCSDGLWSMLNKNDITQIVKKASIKNSDIAKNLVFFANENGGNDNISVIVIAFN